MLSQQSKGKSRLEILDLKVQDIGEKVTQQTNKQNTSEYNHIYSYYLYVFILLGN
jgi:hypothetical protein